MSRNEKKQEQPCEVALYPPLSTLVPPKHASEGPPVLTKSSLFLGEPIPKEGETSTDGKQQSHIFRVFAFNLANENDGPHWSRALPKAASKREGSAAQRVEEDRDDTQRFHHEAEHVFRWHAIDQFLGDTDADVLCVQESIYGTARHPSVHPPDYLTSRGFKHVSRQQGMTHAGYVSIYSKHPFVFDGATGPDDQSMTYNFPVVVVEPLPKVRVCISSVHLGPFPDGCNKRQRQLCKVMNAMHSVCGLPANERVNATGIKGNKKSSSSSCDCTAVDGVKLCVIAGDTNMLNAERVPKAFQFVDVFDCFIDAPLKGHAAHKAIADDRGVHPRQHSFSPNIMELNNEKENELCEEFCTFDGRKNDYNGKLGKFCNRYDRVLVMAPQWMKDNSAEKNDRVKAQLTRTSNTNAGTQDASILLKRLQVIDIKSKVSLVENTAQATSTSDDQQRPSTSWSEARYVSDHYAMFADFDLTALL